METTKRETENVFNIANHQSNSYHLYFCNHFAIILQSKLSSFNHFVKERFITRKAQEINSRVMRPYRTTSQAFSNKFILLSLIILNSTINIKLYVAMSRDNLSYLHKSLILKRLQTKVNFLICRNITYNYLNISPTILSA
jgi:hypothetical protein